MQLIPDRNQLPILLVDDDVALLGVMEESLQDEPNLRVCVTHSADEARAVILDQPWHIVIADYDLKHPDINGLDLLRLARERDPSALVVIITAYASIEMSLEAIQLGAYDYLTKPFQIEELKLTVRNAADQFHLSAQNAFLRDQVLEMARALVEIRDKYDHLMKQLQVMKERSPYKVSLGEGGVAARQESVNQVQLYQKMGETIGERVRRENERLELLYREGLISEEIFLKSREKLTQTTTE